MRDFVSKISEKKTTTRFFYPYGSPVAQGGVSFPYVFSVQNPALKMAWKSSWWIILQYFYIEYETRGGVDVIPCGSTLEKSKIRDFVLKLEKTRFFSVTNLCISGKPRTWRGLKNRKFFFLKSALQHCVVRKALPESGSIFPKIDQNRPKFPGISGKISPGNFSPEKFSGIFPKFSSEISRNFTNFQLFKRQN